MEFIEDASKPLTERRYPDWAKENLIKLLDSVDELNRASDDEIILYKQFCEELASKDNITAINAVGYGCYGGNRAFSCDWKKSEECMLKLIELDTEMPEQASYFNTLGYIYYYGRCNDGVPEYEKAYKYFSFAAFNGIYEAQYKIADMYKNGYGVPKSLATSKNIVGKLYEENLKYIADGVFNSKFADIALRMGGNLEDCDEADKNYDAILYYYMQADFAIRMRTAYNHYGDKKVMDSITQSLSRVKQEMKYKPQKTLDLCSLVNILNPSLANGQKIILKVKENYSGNLKLTFKPYNKKNRLFITIPELDICGRFDSFSVIAEPNNEDWRMPLDSSVIDKVDYYGCYFDSEEVLDFFDFDFTIRATKKEEKEYRFVAVAFDSSNRYYDYLCDDENVKENDKILVDAAGDETEVYVNKVFTKKESELYLPAKYYKTVIKKL